MRPNIPNILTKINKEIDKYNFGTQPQELYEPIKYIMALGGKRMRPLLTVLSANLFTDNIEKSIKPSLAVEVFHNFTLMHDDIMDKAPLRRGQPTVHEKWNGNTAILSGDVMLVKAYELMLDLDDSVIKEAIKSFNKCAAEVCEGQQLDMNFETTNTVTEDQYLQMIKLKTATLLGFSLELGGIIGGANKKNLELLQKFGINIGIGFQLMDDLLDVYGDQKKFGKQVGGDITANKKTFLLIKAFEKANKEDLKNLEKNMASIIANPEKKIKEITEIYNKLDIKNLTENTINFYFQEGLKNLSKIDAPLYKKYILKTLAEKLLNREN